MENPSNRDEAERWIEVARKLLEAKDLHGSRRFVKKAQESNSQVDGADQMIAVIDVLLAAEKRINNHLDWYSILQLDRRSTHDVELIKRQYRKLALLLHPDKNKFPLSDHAFKFVCDAWAFLSDPSKKSLYDNELNLFIKFDPIILKSQKPPPPVRQSVRDKKMSAKASAAAAAAAEEVEKKKQQETSHGSSRLSTFWTVCPYCYHLYEYPRVYEDCCLRCQNCRRAFQAVVVPSPPPSIGSGKDLYYCTWSFFPIRFTTTENLAKNSNVEKNIDVDGDLEDVRVGKKMKTGNVDGNGGNVGNRDVPHKSVRIKTTARKSVRPKPKVVEGNSDPNLVGVDLNMGVKSEAGEAKTTDGVEGMQDGSIDKEATEGIGFFEGLDDILGNLPIE